MSKDIVSFSASTVAASVRNTDCATANYRDLKPNSRSLASAVSSLFALDEEMSYAAAVSDAKFSFAGGLSIENLKPCRNWLSFAG